MQKLAWSAINFGLYRIMQDYFGKLDSNGVIVNNSRTYDDIDIKF